MPTDSGDDQSARSSTKKKAEAKTATRKKAATKAPASKKAAAKSSSKKAATRKSAPKSASSTPKIDPVIQQTLSSVRELTERMREEQQLRDRQLQTLAEEVRKGFSILSERNDEESRQREREMTRLYKTLNAAFEQVEQRHDSNEDRNMVILKALTETIRKDHELTLKEVQEQEKLQDKKLSELDRVYSQRTRRNRWIAVPAVILALIAIFYMFRVVYIMETAMSSMSGDMALMQESVANMSRKMDTLTADTSAMSANLAQINAEVSGIDRNLGLMRNDVGYMSRQVTPAMKGMRDMMPWVK